MTGRLVWIGLVAAAFGLASFRILGESSGFIIANAIVTVGCRSEPFNSGAAWITRARYVVSESRPLISKTACWSMAR